MFSGFVPLLPEDDDVDPELDPPLLLLVLPLDEEAPLLLLVPVPLLSVPPPHAPTPTDDASTTDTIPSSARTKLLFFMRHERGNLHAALRSADHAGFP